MSFLKTSAEKLDHNSCPRDIPHIVRHAFKDPLPSAPRIQHSLKPRPSAQQHRRRAALLHPSLGIPHLSPRVGSRALRQTGGATGSTTTRGRAPGQTLARYSAPQRRLRYTDSDECSASTHRGHIGCGCLVPASKSKLWNLVSLSGESRDLFAR